MHSPTLSDVARAYRLFLGREVESTGVAGHHLATAAHIWDLIERIWGSPEALRLRIGQAAGAIGMIDDRPLADPWATSEQFARMFAQLEADWASRGLGACHRHLTRDEPRFDTRSATWEIERRFQRAEDEARAFHALVAATGTPFDAAGDALVLGEDSYRLAGALTRGAYVGVEPRPDAVKAGEAALAARGLAGAEVVTVPAFRTRPLSYDVFYSVMTLQHAPPPVSLALLARALEQVRPGGLAYFQLACHLHDYRFETEAYLAGEGRAPEGEIHALPQHHVLALLDRHGFAPIEVKPDGRLGSLGVSYAFFARKRA